MVHDYVPSRLRSRRGRPPCHGASAISVAQARPMLWRNAQELRLRHSCASADRERPGKTSGSSGTSGPQEPPPLEGAAFADSEASVSSDTSLPKVELSPGSDWAPFGRPGTRLIPVGSDSSALEGVSFLLAPIRARSKALHFGWARFPRDESRSTAGEARFWSSERSSFRPRATSPAARKVLFGVSTASPPLRALLESHSPWRKSTTGGRELLDGLDGNVSIS